MLCVAVARLSSRTVASAFPRGCFPNIKYATELVSLKSINHPSSVKFSRNFSSTLCRYQTTPVELHVATTAATAQNSESTTSTPPGAVEPERLENALESIYSGEYLPHNTQIYNDYLMLEQTLTEKPENIVDISSTSNVTIPEIAEGLSSDLLLASGINPSLQDMGLGSYVTPPGLLQNALDIIYNMGLPWWATIAVVTITLKSFMVPVVIKSHKNATIMNNNMPEMQRLQLKMTEARRCGNMLEASRTASELALFMKEKEVNVFKGLVPMLIQAPIFISFFMALRGMANLPMESMKTGGLWWFTDLTVPDPYFILPIITCSSVLIMFETGADGATRADNLKHMKYIMRGIPFVMFPFIMNFPAAILCYWSTSNLFSLGQTIIFRRPLIREKLNIPALVKHPKKELPLSKGFVKDVKESYKNIKISQEIGNRARSDEIRFKQAGLGPVVKTFKHPQQRTPPANN